MTTMWTVGKLHDNKTAKDSRLRWSQNDTYYLYHVYFRKQRNMPNYTEHFLATQMVRWWPETKFWDWVHFYRLFVWLEPSLFHSSLWPLCVPKPCEFRDPPLIPQMESCDTLGPICSSCQHWQVSHTKSISDQSKVKSKTKGNAFGI